MCEIDGLRCPDENYHGSEFFRWSYLWQLVAFGASWYSPDLITVQKGLIHYEYNMLVSSLLDMEPSAKYVPAEVGLEWGIEDYTETSIDYLFEDKFDNDGILRHSKSSSNETSECAVPSTARFIPFHAPPFIQLSVSCTLPLPRATTKQNKARTKSDILQLRAAILAVMWVAGQALSEEKNGYHSSHRWCEEAQKECTKKQQAVTTVAEDSLGHQAQVSRTSKVAESCELPVQTTGSAPVLGKMSQKTLHKLHAFEYTPPIDCAVVLGKI